MQHQFSTDQPVSLYVEIGRGSVTVEAVETAETVVEVTGAEADRVSVGQSGRQIAIVAPRHSGFGGGRDQGVEVVVTVPLDSDLLTKLGSADTIARGRYGIAKLKSGSGNILLDQATGVVVVDTGSGDTELMTVGGDLRVKSGSGDVRIGTAAGSVGISTGSGDVRIGTTNAAAVLKTGSGDLTVQRAETDLSLSTASGDLEVGRFSRGGLRAKSASGDVRIGIPRGVPVWTDITSVSGRVGSDLEPTGQPAEGQEHAEVRATTVSGDVVLRQLS
ncbi:MAG: DUF4097 family beta strand repeat-containing protein [Marmoricola sp.]